MVGGGFRQSRVGELAIARTDIILKAEDFDIDLVPIRFHPDEAGLIGTLHLAPSWIFEGHDSILAVDIGGTNIRAAWWRPAGRRRPIFPRPGLESELWRHADDEPTREGAVKRLVKMLKDLIAAAEGEGLKLAPFIGIACPGVIDADGSIEKGAQNLPGNWESSKFNLPASLVEAIPQIGGHETAVVMHNDAVVQGLSEVPFMQDVEHWGVLTIGTGLGNARFTNRRKESGKDNGKDEKRRKRRQGLTFPRAVRLMVRLKPGSRCRFPALLPSFRRSAWPAKPHFPARISKQRHGTVSVLSRLAVPPIFLSQPMRAKNAAMSDAERSGSSQWGK